jgi:hypothetical protein
MQKEANAMDNTTHRETAQIYQFPVARTRHVGHRPDTERLSQRIADAVLDDCWYHDEAVRQSAAPAKPKGHAGG